MDGWNKQWMDDGTDRWMDEETERWMMNGCKKNAGWMKGWMDERIERWMDEQTERWMDERTEMNGWTDREMDGSISSSCHFSSTWNLTEIEIGGQFHSNSHSWTKSKTRNGQLRPANYQKLVLAVFSSRTKQTNIHMHAHVGLFPVNSEALKCLKTQTRIRYTYRLPPTQICISLSHTHTHTHTHTLIEFAQTH